jgi:nitrous oxidase accessory protein
VKLQASCDGNTFLKNNFIGNTFDISTNGFTVLNNIDKNYWDKYAGYDLNRDGIGDVPFFPVNLFSSITETVPAAILLWRSFLVFMLDQAEKILPAITPENLKDHKPVMKPYDLR